MKLLVKAKDHLDHILSHGDSVKVHEEDDHVERWSQESPKVINANCNTSSKSQTSGDLKISSVLAPSINNLEKVTIFAKSEMEPNSKLPETNWKEVGLRDKTRDFGRNLKMQDHPGCFSVYIGNLSSKVKWRDLKKLFQRFGQVLDVFIPKKTDVSGSNFGFVRFPSKQEAEMAIFMFEGAWVVDRRIQVNLARFRCRSKYWRRKQPKDADCDATFQYYRTQGFDPESRRVEENGCKEPVEAMSPTKARVVSEEAVGGDSRKSSFVCLKKITGHVDDEALRRLERANEHLSISSSDSSSEKVSRKSKASPASRQSLGEADSFKTSSLGLLKHEETNTHKEVGEDGVSGNSKAVSLEKDCYNNEAIPLVTSDIEISGTRKVKEVVGEDMRVGLSALGKDSDFFCDPTGVDVLSMGLHPQYPLDRGSGDKIRGKPSSAEITKRAEKDKDLISTKRDSEEREAPNCVLESQEIDVFCPLDREGLCRRNGKSKASFVDGGSNSERKNFELPEFHNVFKESRLKKKRFGSLNEILEKGLSEVDKRKRDRDKKLEAIKTLEVWKKVGIEFIGDENEVVKDLISLAEKEVATEHHKGYFATKAVLEGVFSLQDMVSASGNWDWFRLAPLLPLEVLEQIAEVQPPQKSSAARITDVSAVSDESETSLAPSLPDTVAVAGPVSIAAAPTNNKKDQKSTSWTDWTKKKISGVETSIENLVSSSSSKGPAFAPTPAPAATTATATPATTTTATTTTTPAATTKKP
ncbi:hypothetical protein V6N11_046446 [Hibiscus sabdariffa]|uniref:RRM domain-containing protein n=1 Tax=Hibiscus sabdariffa TaxID=183260 RepID=A0ABR2P299_9ROSI